MSSVVSVMLEIFTVVVVPVVLVSSVSGSKFVKAQDVSKAVGYSEGGKAGC